MPSYAKERLKDSASGFRAQATAKSTAHTITPSAHCSPAQYAAAIGTPHNTATTRKTRKQSPRPQKHYKPEYVLLQNP